MLTFSIVWGCDSRRCDLGCWSLGRFADQPLGIYQEERNQQPANMICAWAAPSAEVELASLRLGDLGRAARQTRE